MKNEFQTLTHFPIYFKAIVWDIDTQEAVTEEGFITMAELSDALVYLSNYYGKNLMTLKVHPLAEGPVLLSDLDEYREGAKM